MILFFVRLILLYAKASKHPGNICLIDRQTCKGILCWCVCVSLSLRSFNIKNSQYYIIVACSSEITVRIWYDTYVSVVRKGGVWLSETFFSVQPWNNSNNICEIISNLCSAIYQSAKISGKLFFSIL